MMVWAIRFNHQDDGRPVYWRGVEATDLDYTGEPADAAHFSTESLAKQAIAGDLGGSGEAVELDL